MVTTFTHTRPKARTRQEFRTLFGKRSSAEWMAAGESRPFLVRLSAEIKKKRPHMQKKKVLFHQGNAPCHKSMKTMVKLSELSFELLPHPPYSPDLAPSDYWRFADLKKLLQGKRLSSNEEVIAETKAYFESRD